MDPWEGEYTYRCILTNDYESSEKEIVEFYNLRGGKERIFDDMNNGFGWNRLPKSFMGEKALVITQPFSEGNCIVNVSVTYGLK